jgi:hypothetical protein
MPRKSNQYFTVSEKETLKQILQLFNDGIQKCEDVGINLS